MNSSLQFIPGKNHIVQSLDWEKMVWDPMKEHRYIEAFAVADALIDESIESILRQIYNNGCCQELINQLHALKGRLSFDGTSILAILKNKNIVDNKFYERVIKFKKARNLVLHRVQGEHELIDFQTMKKLKSNEEFNQAAIQAAMKELDEAFHIFYDLHELSHKIADKKIKHNTLLAT